MVKRVAIPTRPGASRARAAELWVQQAEAPRPKAAVAMRRLTLDLPEDLHRRIKVACAERGVKMADALRALLAAHYPKSPPAPESLTSGDRRPSEDQTR